MLSVARSRIHIVVRATDGSTPTSFSCGIGIVGLFERTGSFFFFPFPFSPPLRLFFFFSSSLLSALSALPTYQRFTIVAHVLLGLE